MTFLTQKLQRLQASLLVGLIVACAGIGMAGQAAAGVYDNTTTRPGTSIINDIEISWGASGVSPDSISAQNEFTVMPIDSPGTLKAYRFAPESSDATSFYVRRPNHAADPQAGTGFTPVALPSDPAISVPGILPLVETDRIHNGTDVFLVLDDAGLNFDSDAIDSLVLTVTDHTTGDRELLQIYETGTDTGVFAGYLCTCADTGTPGDGRLHTLPHSRIDAIYEDPWRGERKLEDMVLVGPVDPYGLVFDSRTGAPMDGIEVTLVDATTGEPAVVYGNDLAATYPSTITTGSTVVDSSGTSYDLDPGEFRFPFVHLGSYRLEIVPPRGYVAPSEVEDAMLQELPGAPYALGPGSRLEPFEVVAGPPIRLDVPLDGNALIDVTRTGSDDVLTIGDAIRYTVTAGASVEGDVVADILDTLPAGLRIVPSSVRINGAPAEQRTLLDEDGRNITFDDVVIPDGERGVVTYVARISPLAEENKTLDSRSTADARGFISNTATHSLLVESAFGTDTSILLGQVFATGCEARYDPELDLSGIRVYLENGRYVETDEAGLFSFRSLPEGTHVAQIDTLSLPAGYEPVLCKNNTRRAGDADSLFVEANGGFAEMAYFHIAPTGKTDFSSPKARVALRQQDRIQDLDRDWLDASLRDPGIVFPTEGYLPRTRSLELAVVRKGGQSVEVLLNGEEVDPVYRRPAIQSTEGNLYLDAWTGAALEQGRNTIEVTIRDIRGAIVVQDSASVAFNAAVERLEVAEGLSDLSTNGRRKPHVVFRATDAQGIPLHPGTIVTVSVKHPFLFAGETAADARSQRASATVDADGLFRLDLEPSRRSGVAKFRIATDDHDVSTEAFISAAERPWLLVGLADGTAAHRTIAEHMEHPMEAGVADIDPVAVSGRVSLFAEGVIAGKWLATLRYDSAIDADERDFFAVDPDAQYVVYGDASVEGDAAQSRHPLYLRLQSETTDILYGDFDTDLRDGPASYSRKLTGGRISFMGEAVEATVFAASTEQTFVEDAFTANGTSGPFQLTRQNVLAFSERVFVETSARGDSERIIDRVQLKRGTDYDIDYTKGRIFLAEPLLARDGVLNPNTIIVEYEVETSDHDGIIVGGRIVLKPSDQVRLGATAVREDYISGSDGAGELVGLDAEIQLAKDLVARAGVAMSRQNASNTMTETTTAHSGELAIAWETEDSQAEIYVRSQDTAFGIDNQDSESDHVVSTGAVADVLLDSQSWEDADGTEHLRTLRLQGEGKHERNLDTDETVSSAEALVVRETDGVLRGGGLRAVQETAIDEAGPTSGFGLKAVGLAGWKSDDERLRLTFGQEITVLENGDVSDFDKGTIELEYDATDRFTIKASNELAFENGLHGSIFALGADYRAWEGATLSFGGLRASDGEDNTIVGHAGLDQEIALSEKWMAHIGIQRQTALASTVADGGPVAVGGLSNPRLGEGFTTLTFGLDRTVESWSIGTDIEHRMGEESDSTRWSVSSTGDLSEALSYGAKASLLATTEKATGETGREHELTASFAYRPRDSRTAVLDQFEIRRSDEDYGSRSLIMNSTFVTREFDGGHALSMRHGIKWSRFDFDGDAYSDILNLAGAEYRYDINDWLDMGAQGSVLHSMETSSMSYSAGLSVGFTPFENGWVSAGYNFAGFEDEDFSALGQTAQGPFVQFRMKFDRDSFRSLFGSR